MKKYLFLFLWFVTIIFTAIWTFENPEKRVISLVDINGKLLHHESTQQTSVRINLPTNNICFLNVAEKRGAKTIKLLSQ